MLDTLRNRWNGYRALRVRQTSRYKADMAQVPAGLCAYWQASAQHEFAGIPRDDYFFASALEGLLNFFDCARHSARSCALPSVAADSIWHAWIRMDEHGLDNFCVKRFGRVIPHVEAAAMADEMEMALAVCLVQSRTLEQMPTGHARVPRLFALDRVLGMPNGYDYDEYDGAVGLWRMDASGCRTGCVAYPPALGVHRLFSAGLISKMAYIDATHVRRRVDGTGVGGGSASGCDSGAAGASCGGAGCGGGCGS